MKFLKAMRAASNSKVSRDKLRKEMLEDLRSDEKYPKLITYLGDLNCEIRSEQAYLMKDPESGYEIHNLTIEYSCPNKSEVATLLYQMHIDGPKEISLNFQDQSQRLTKHVSVDDEGNIDIYSGSITSMIIKSIKKYFKRFNF